MASQPTSFSKRHVSGMLKFMTDDAQRIKALETAATYKALFAEKKWEPVLSKLWRFAEEDHLRIQSRRRPHPQLTTSVSAPSPDTHATPIALPRHTTAPSSPRERWDVLYRGGHVTPLSPSPMGNAFADGGFWSELSPKTSVPRTALTAIPYSTLSHIASPRSPIVPEGAEARAAYDLVKAEVDAMARTVCAARMSAHSTIRDSGDIPQSLIRPRDLLRGAEIVLRYRQIDLSSAIDADLPAKLRTYADEEARIYAQYCVRDLRDVDAWLSVDEGTLAFSTILDAQRELVHMHHHRRKSKDVKLEERAVGLVWVTRVLEDVEREVEAEGEGSDEEEGGYEYGNFLRSIRGESSGAVSLQLSRESTYASTPQSQRSSTSLRKSQRGSTSPTKPSTRRSSTIPRKPSTSPTKKHDLLLRTTTEPRLSLSIVTSHVSEKDVTAPELSPEDKAQRRMGVRHGELDAWATQLRAMQETQQRNKESVMSAYSGGGHPALRTSQRESIHVERGGEQSQPDNSNAARPPSLGSRPPLPMGFKYAPALASPSSVLTSDAAMDTSLHDAVRRKQHVRSRSSVERREEWGRELESMESTERVRQSEVLGFIMRGSSGVYGGMRGSRGSLGEGM